MKTISLTLILGCMLCSLQAQQIFGTVPSRLIKDKRGEIEIQAHCINDSLFVANNLLKDTQSAFWVLPDKRLVELNNPILKNKVFVLLTSTSDSVSMYYLEDNNDVLSLKALIQSKNSNELAISKKSVSFTGRYLTLFKDSTENLFLVSIVKERSELHIIELNNLNTVKEKIIKTPFSLNDADRQFVFVNEGVTLSPADAECPNKIFKKGHILYVCVDKYNTSPGITSIAKMDLATEKSEVHDIIDTDLIPFRTYIESDRIYKLSKSREKGCVLNVYDLSSFTKLKSMAIGKTDKNADKPAFKKDFLVTHNKESVWDALSNSSSGFVTATTIDSTVFLKIGSHHTITLKSSNVPVMHGFPLLTLITASIKLATLSVSEPVSVDQYFYLTWKNGGNILYPTVNESADQKIDVYDVQALKEKRRFDYKGYVRNNNLIYGLYHEEGKGMVDIILFKNSNR